MFPIQLPPLRERRDDIPLLLDRLLKTVTIRHQKEINGIDRAAVELLQRYDWPGNVRELENVLERAVALAQAGEVIGRAHLPESVRGRDVEPFATGAAPSATSPAAVTPADRPPLRQARAEFEADYIRKVLTEHNRNVSHTARALGLSRVMLQKKMKEYGLREQ